MTRYELQALRRECVVCGGTGRARGEGSPDYSAAVWMTCHTCAGTGYVLPATDEVMEMAKEADDAG
jgi:DnaJ-class molecular chaperone